MARLEFHTMEGFGSANQQSLVQELIPQNVLLEIVKVNWIEMVIFH